MPSLSSRALRRGLPLAVLLASLQPAAPAAAQVVSAAVSGGATRGMPLGAVGGRSAVGAPLSAPVLAPSLISSLSAPSVLAPMPAPSPRASAAASLTAVSAAVAAPIVIARSAVQAVQLAAPPALAFELPAPLAGGTRPSRVSKPAAAAAKRLAGFTAAVSIEGRRFDGGRAALNAVADPSGGAAAAAGSEAAPSRSLLSRFVAAPLSAAVSPAVAAWSYAREGAAAVSENAAWVRGFWRDLSADGVDVGAELKTASAMALVMAAVALAPSWLYGQMAQHLKDLQTLETASGLPWYQVPVLQTFAALSLSLVAVHALSAFLTRYQSRTMYTLGNKLMKGVSDLYVAKVLSLDMRWQNSRSVGDVVSTATDAIYTLQSTASAMVVDLVRHGAVALISGAVMLAVSWQLSLFTIPFLIFVLSIPSAIYSKRVQDAYRSFFAMKKPRFAGALQEIVVNILKVKAAGREAAELEKMRGLSHQTYMVGGGEIADVAAPQRALAGGLTDVAKVLVIAAAVWAVYLGTLPVAAAVMYIFLANFFREAMQALSGLWVSLKSMRGAAARYDKTMRQVSEDMRSGGTVLAPAAGGRRVEMRGVKFRYTADGAQVLKGLDLDIKAGEMVGLVGMSGGGKTTAALALLGLYPLEAGEIVVDGVPLGALDLRAYRGSVGVSLQDSIPFAATLSENIAYLRPGAQEADIWDAARAAGLHEQIVRFGADRAVSAEAAGDPETAALLKAIEARLPALRAALDAGIPAGEAAARAGALDEVTRLGYRMRVGERGINISGGQKQRLMLAQLFIRSERPFGLMIYDEPTAALDGRSQQLIEDQIALRRGKSTQIVIAHRLSNVQRADRIVVFSEGAVVEQGTHDELMAAGGVYAKMWDAQRLLDAAAQQTARVQ